MRENKKKYEQIESTNIVVGIGYMVEIDGEQISIEPQYFHHYSVTQQLAQVLKQLNPEIENDQSWQYEISFATDYDEQYIKQSSWNVMSVRRQFYDGSDVEEKLCDAKTFYKELIKINDWVIENVSAGADLQYVFPKNYQYTLQGLKDSLQTIKDRPAQGRAMTLRLKLFVLIAGVIIFATSGVTAVALWREVIRGQELLAREPGAPRTCRSNRIAAIGNTTDV